MALNHQVGSPWRLDRKKVRVGQQVEVGLGWAMGGSRGRCLCYWRIKEVVRRGHRWGRAVPVSRRVIPGAVGAASRGSNAAVENWFEVPTLTAGWIGASVFCFRVSAGAESTYGRVLASGFDMAKSPTIVALLRRRGGVGTLNEIVATENWNFGDIK